MPGMLQKSPALMPRYYKFEGIRLLPWVSDVNALVGPRMKDDRRGKPVSDQLRHAFPCEPTFLAASPERSPSEIGDIVPERQERSAICRDRVISEVASPD